MLGPNFTEVFGSLLIIKERDLRVLEIVLPKLFSNCNCVKIAVR